MSAEGWAAIAAIVACIFTGAVVLWRGGSLVGRVEATLERLLHIERHVEKVPELVVKVGTLEHVTGRLVSDHRELAADVNQMRGRLDSQHD